MALGNDAKMQELVQIQAKLQPKEALVGDFAYGCDCTGCTNACFESCGDGLGPMS